MKSLADMVRDALTDEPQSGADIARAIGMPARDVMGTLASLAARGHIEKVRNNAGNNVTWRNFPETQTDPNLYFNQFIRNRIQGEQNAAG